MNDLVGLSLGMTLDDYKQLDFPDTPGVYLFRAAGRLGLPGKILYIGKATSLRGRVRSYFSKDLMDTRGWLIVSMVQKASTVEYIETDSVLEAIILEANLIRKHKPYHNTREKDDKSFNYVVVTAEEWPRVMVVRGKDLYALYTPRQIKYLFGPFPYGRVFKEAMNLIRRMFPFYDTLQPVGEIKNRMQEGKLRFNQQIGRYPAASTDRKEYLRTVNHLRLFFEGKKKKLLAELERDMKRYAKRQEFEQAGEMKRRMFAVTHIQDLALVRDEIRNPVGENDMRFRVEAYDVAHISGTSTTGVMVVVENGEVKKSDYRKFRIRIPAHGGDTTALKEVLERRLRHHEWQLPDLIVADGGIAQKHTIEMVLEARDLPIPVVAVTKDERHKPKLVIGSEEHRVRREKEILLANAEAHRFAISYHKLLRSKRMFGDA